MDPPRFELTTPGLQDQSSTTELNLGRKFSQKIEVKSIYCWFMSSVPFLGKIIFTGLNQLWPCKPVVVSSNYGESIVILDF